MHSVKSPSKRVGLLIYFFLHYVQGAFNKSLENPRDGARIIENCLVLVSIITH